MLAALADDLVGEKYSVGDENDEHEDDKIDLFEQDVPDDCVSREGDAFVLSLLFRLVVCACTCRLMLNEERVTAADDDGMLSVAIVELCAFVNDPLLLVVHVAMVQSLCVLVFECCFCTEYSVDESFTLRCLLSVQCLRLRDTFRLLAPLLHPLLLPLLLVLLFRFMLLAVAIDLKLVPILAVMVAVVAVLTMLACCFRSFSLFSRSLSSSIRSW